MVTNTLDTIEYGSAASASARQTGRSRRHPQAARAAAPLGRAAGARRERRAREPGAPPPRGPPGAEHEPPGPEPGERRQLLRPADDAGDRLGVHGMRGEEERGRPGEPRPVRDLA